MHSLLYIRCPPARAPCYGNPCRLQSGGHSILPSIGVRARLFSWLGRLAVSDVSTGSLIPGGLLFCPPQSWRGRGRLHNPQQQVSQFNLVATELGRFCLVTPGPRGERRHRRALHHLVSMIHERAYIEKKTKPKRKRIIPASLE